MSFAEEFKIMWPTVLVHFVIFSSCLTLSWFVITKIYRQFTFHWAAPVTIGVSFSFLFYAHFFVTNYQQTQLVVAAKAQEQKAAVDRETQAQAFLKLKEDFLKTVDYLVSSKDAITDEVKKKITQSFGPLIGTPEAKNYAANSVFTLYSCNVFFLKDAVDSFKNKKVVKSDDRRRCEGYDGGFFNREKLLMPEIVKNNDETLKKIALHEKLPTADGKVEEVDEAKLKANLDRQVQMVDNIKKLFN